MPLLIEIDVIGYRQGFNAAARQDVAEDNQIVYSFRQINADEISVVDEHEPLGAHVRDFRSSRSKITMKNGEIIYCQRSVQEIARLIDEARHDTTHQRSSVFEEKPDLKGSACNISHTDFRLRPGFADVAFGYGYVSVPFVRGSEVETYFAKVNIPA